MVLRKKNQQNIFVIGSHSRRRLRSRTTHNSVVVEYDTDSHDAAQIVAQLHKPGSGIAPVGSLMAP